MINDLVIVGASGFGREVAWLVERINSVNRVWNIIGFMDDNDDLQGENINGYEVIGTIKDANKYKQASFVCAIGSSAIRHKVISELIKQNPDVQFATLIDPSVKKSDYVSIGDGSIICSDTTLTVNINIGKHVIINLDCTVGHDAVIKNYVTLYPSVNVSGNSTINSCVELGTGTQIIQGITVTSDTIIGAGAVVVKDIAESGTYAGVPAKRIK